MAARLRRIRERDQRGSALVELLLVSPVLLLIVFGIIDFGFVYSDQIELNQAVRETARQLTKAEYLGCGDGDSQCVFDTQVPGDVDVTGLWIIAPGSPEAGLPVTVCAEGSIDPITPIAGPILGGKSIKAKVTMRVENNIELGGGALGTMQSVGSGIPSWCTHA